MTDRELLKIAFSMTERAYAPFSGFCVGAALLTKDGRVFTGVNIENSSLGATICAERTAFVKAISEGAREFEAVAVVSGEGAVWPCGICRQPVSRGLPPQPPKMPQYRWRSIWIMGTAWIW